MGKFTLLFFITIFEALIGIWVKLIDGNIPIFTVNFLRVFFAMLIVAAILPFIDKIRFEKEKLKDSFIIGGLIALQISIFNVAMTLAPVANVVIFWSINPFFVFLYSHFLLKEKVEKVHALIFLIGFVGLYISNPLQGLEEHVLGNMLSLTGGFAYATLVTFMRREKDDSPRDVFWYFLFASILLAPALGIAGVGNWLQPASVQLFGATANVPPVVWALGLGAITTGLTFVFIRLILNKIKASVYAIFDVLISPAIAALFAFLILQEVPEDNVIYG